MNLLCELCGDELVSGESVVYHRLSGFRSCVLHQAWLALSEPTCCLCDVPVPDGLGECGRCRRRVLPEVLR